MRCRWRLSLASAIVGLAAETTVWNVRGTGEHGQAPQRMTWSRLLKRVTSAALARCPARIDAVLYQDGDIASVAGAGIAIV